VIADIGCGRGATTCVLSRRPAVWRRAAIVAVKSADSYRELDLLMAASGLDPDAPGRPSLYETAHSGTIDSLAAASLDVR
jgi:hypothetical protein